MQNHRVRGGREKWRTTRIRRTRTAPYLKTRDVININKPNEKIFVLLHVRTRTHAIFIYRNDDDDDDETVDR